MKTTLALVVVVLLMIAGATPSALAQADPTLTYLGRLDNGLNPIQPLGVGPVGSLTPYPGPYVFRYQGAMLANIFVSTSPNDIFDCTWGTNGTNGDWRVTLVLKPGASMPVPEPGHQSALNVSVVAVGGHPLPLPQGGFVQYVTTATLSLWYNPNMVAPRMGLSANVKFCKSCVISGT